MKTATLKSWNLSCPKCGAGSDETVLSLDVNDLAAGITCGECSETYTVESAVALATENLRRWVALSKWISLAGACLANPSTE